MAKKKRSGMLKGGPFEREIAIELSYWWTEDLNDDVIWRTAGSGARAKTRSKSGLVTKYQYGDLAPTNPTAFPLFDYFLFELKRGYTKTIDSLSILDNLPNRKKPIILQWWDEAEIDRKLGERKENILIFQRDSHQKCVVISNRLFGKLEPICGGYPYPYQEICTTGYHLIICLFSDFFTYMDPKDVALLS